MAQERKTGIYGGRDPRDLPLYTIGQAARYLHLAPATLRSWPALDAVDGPRTIGYIVVAPCREIGHKNGTDEMQPIFFLIRLPLFVLGVWAWLVIGILALAIGFLLAPLIPFAALIWSVVLFGALIGAASNNDSSILSSFLRSTWAQVVEAAESLWAYIVDYFRGYYELWKWLLAQK